MKLFPNHLLFCLFAVSLLFACTPEKESELTSPDGRMGFKLISSANNEVFYQLWRDGTVVIDTSRLGFLTSEIDPEAQLKYLSASAVKAIDERYKLHHGKQTDCHYLANERSYTFLLRSGDTVSITFRLSNDGLAFRYELPAASSSISRISGELTSFNFPETTKTWIQPRATSKSGWNQVNPSYEEHYQVEALLSDLSRNDSGWIFPVLLKTPSSWVSITESWPENEYCGSHLNKGIGANELKISFPEETEGFTNGEVYPAFETPWVSPWRIITIGDLSTIAESTLGTDLAYPPYEEQFEYVAPGRASWSWALMKDPSVNFENQVKFINYASDMGWEYCLIDVEWDTRIGWTKIKELIALADSKNVGLILWYNSAGDWNTVPYHPKDILTDSVTRRAEFAKLHNLGIKGVKVDFFGGDGQSMMDYYQDILHDAHTYKLMVNCHGATLPRGLHRTWPNLVSMESVRGFEYATFGQETADRVAIKATILPFTRNANDPMDFTPVCFNDYDAQTRKTGNGAELAQAVLFVSGVQHYAETPWGMEKVPEYVKDLMRKIPNSWDEVKFVDGYPGKYIVLARRKGDDWYIAGINAQNDTLDLELDLAFLDQKNVFIITEADSLRSFTKRKVKVSAENKVQLNIMPNGGFVIAKE